MNKPVKIYPIQHDRSISLDQTKRAAEIGNLLRVQPVFGGLGRNELKKDFTWRSHQHNDYQIIFADRGMYRCSVNNVTLRLKPNDILVVKPGDWHEDFCRKGQRYYAANIQLLSPMHDVAAPILFAEGIDPHMQCFRGQQNEFKPLLRKLRDEYRTSDRYSARLQDALIMELFWRLVRQVPRSALSPEFRMASKASLFLSTLYRLFHRHLGESMSVGEMARALSMSESALTQACRKMLRTSPAQAFLRYKMEEAKTWITNSHLEIKEIAYQMGFRNPYHFSKAFKRIYKKPPVDFRS